MAYLGRRVQGFIYLALIKSIISINFTAIGAIGTQLLIYDSAVETASIQPKSACAD
jgi:TM2 domain-containing membrane protein YozV